MKALEKVKLAALKDPELYADRGALDTTFGHNPAYLEEVHGITKSDLIRLERVGLAQKVRYVTRNQRGTYFPYKTEDVNGNPTIEKYAVDGPHRTRWLIFRQEDSK